MADENSKTVMPKQRQRGPMGGRGFGGGRSVEKAKDFKGTMLKLLGYEAINGLAMMAQQGKTFDLIFSDPPYNKGLNRKVVEALEKWPVLKPGGLLVLEHSLEEDPGDYLPRARNFRQEKYGGYENLPNSVES